MFENGFVAVHVGAGYHAEGKLDEYKRTCEQAVNLLKKNCSASDALVASIVELENSLCTNAGIGSNLTLDGEVECDAGIMDGNSLNYGSVGAISGVKNPILVAKKLLNEQSGGPLSHGRIHPSFLVGEGARQWSLNHGVSLIDSDNLKTESSIKSYLKNKRKLEDVNGSLYSSDNLHSKKKRPEDLCNLCDDGIQDTVGAVCIDSSGNFVAGVSSGGISMKHPGRIGQACIYGAGCWAENSDETCPGVAVSTSGCGEYLVKTQLAKGAAESLKTDKTLPCELMSDFFQNQFLDSKYLKGVQSKLGGLIALCGRAYDGVMYGELIWGHTTETMCLGFMSTNDSKPKSCVSTLHDINKVGSSVYVQGKSFKFKLRDS